LYRLAKSKNETCPNKVEISEWDGYRNENPFVFIKKTSRFRKRLKRTCER